MSTDTTNAKVRSLEELGIMAGALARRGTKVIHCHGVFDLEDAANLQHFAAAKAMGDILILTVIADAALEGESPRVLLSEWKRVEVLAAVPSVDFVALCPSVSAAPAIRALRPSVFVIAPGQDGRFGRGRDRACVKAEEDAVREVGGLVRRVKSSEAIRRPPAWDEETTSFRNFFRKRHSAAEILAQVEWLGRLRVLVVGETILDEYVHCDAMGKSGKEPFLVMHHKSQDMYPGGVLAIANHVAEFCDQVTLLSCLGDSNSHEEFIRSRLKRAVRPTFVTKPGSPTIVKRRYLDAYSHAKVFGVYQMNDEPIGGAAEDELVMRLGALLPESDVVIVADYGHGMLTPRAIELVANQSRVLAINTQLNAANVGFHTVSKYPRADYVCIHEGELRLDARVLRGDLKPLMVDLARRMSASTVMVTRGKRGNMLYRESDGFYSCPAFADKVIERIGSGDAVLSLTALCVAAGIPPDVVGFLGNLAGAQAVAIMGNSESISKARLVEAIEGIMRGTNLRRAIG